VRQLDLFSSNPDDAAGREPPAPPSPAVPPVAVAAPPPSAPAVAAVDGVLVARGPRAAEAALLARLAELGEESRREPARLALPVRVVVPSRSLRRHLAARLVQGGRWAGAGAVAGVTVQTLYGLACEVLERAGRPAPRGVHLFETLVEREARRERLLRQGLGDLVDGFLPVAVVVADLLDAAFEPEHADALDEVLAADGPRTAGRAEIERARALVRVAARTELRLREAGLGRRSNLLREAADALAVAPDEALPARAVLLHGFIAPGGVVADLVALLLRRPQALLVVDQPPRPGAGGEVEAAATLRLIERLRGLVPVAAPAAPAPGEPAAGGADRCEAFTAAGTDAEVREVARRLRRVLDGMEPGAGGGGLAREGGPAMPAAEGLAVVARDLAPYRAALRRHLGRLGVPYSGIGEPGGLVPAGRRAVAALDLLRLGTEAPADRWLDACDNLPAALRVDLRLALRALGAARLRDVAALRAEAFDSGLALPIRQGLAALPVAAVAAVAAAGAAEDSAGLEVEEDEGRAVAKARRISGRQLRWGVQAAVRVHDRLAAWPRRSRAGEQLAALRGLLGELGLDDAAQPLAAALAQLQQEVPAAMLLDGEELRLLATRALGDRGESALGGAGGGVQVLSVAEARGRTFDRLFLLGLNRDRFPRPVRDDPLLPDDLRQVLRRVLSDLPLRRDAFDDERHAFAQLLDAAPVVCLSWQLADDDGKALSSSPLVERLLAAAVPLVPEAAPALYAVPGAAAPPGGAGGGAALAAERPADEHAVLAGLGGARHELERLLPFAVRQVRDELGTAILDLDPAAVAAARLRVLDEQDPDLRTAAGRRTAASLGPYFGFVGEERYRPGHALHITHLEALAACPWQLFLGRLLRIERAPDPLGALPGADPLRLGNLVHRVLDRLVQAALDAAPGRAAGDGGGDGGGEGAAAAGRAVAVRWPEAAVVDAALTAVAAEILAEEGLVLPGLAAALAEQARPYVEAAREVDWPDGEARVAVVASEMAGELTLGGHGEVAARRVRFRADRLDRVAAGVRFTDYKTGKPLSNAKVADKRRLKLLAEIQAGRKLQAVAYVLSADDRAMGSAGDRSVSDRSAGDRSAGDRAVGRYLFLGPSLPSPAAREVAVETADADARHAFAKATDALLGAWAAGTFFPRVVDPAGRKEPTRCQYCTVSEACLRYDSGARRRLVLWAEQARAAAASDAAADPGGALLAVWDLAVPEDEG
jgi:hypothetical protein